MKLITMKRKKIWGVISIVALMIIVIGWEYYGTFGRTQLQINIHQNKELIYLSTFAEPPQFAIWLENPKTNEIMTIFVTHRIAVNDWEGKSTVPVALPRWFQLFMANKERIVDAEKAFLMPITGATPKDDYFSIRVEVKPESKWICWIEVNLAGDYNEAFPEQDIESYVIDEFANGQPALLFKSELVAEEGRTFNFELEAQSVWEKGETRVEPVSDGVTTARDIFDEMNIEIIQPKPKLIEKRSIP